MTTYTKSMATYSFLANGPGSDDDQVLFAGMTDFTWIMPDAQDKLILLGNISSPEYLLVGSPYYFGNDLIPEDAEISNAVVNHTEDSGAFITVHTILVESDTSDVTTVFINDIAGTPFSTFTDSADIFDFVFGSARSPVPSNTSAGLVYQLSDLNGITFTEDDDITGTKGTDSYRTGRGNDIINAKAGDDRVKAGLGDDEVFGRDGKDRLFGQYGDDVVFGGDGNDYIDGGHGNDTLKGGKDVDKFVFREFGGDDLILDFEAGTDWLKIARDNWNGRFDTDSLVERFVTTDDDGWVVLAFASTTITLKNVIDSSELADSIIIF